MAKLKQKKKTKPAIFTIEFDREEDGRWIAEVRELPGVMAYGATKQEVLHKVYVIALKTLIEEAEEKRAFSRISNLFNYEMASS